jgi:drug/metabolite transporter (DMT)-like permease
MGGAVAFALAVALVALLGERAEDNALAWSLLGLMVAGLVSSLTAFVTAIIGRIRRRRTRRDWIPLAIFPAIVAFIVLGEAFWWE